MKLRLILEFRDRICGLQVLLDRLEDDFLQLIDDDLWTVDLEAKPVFTDDYEVKFVSDVVLTDKYVRRFCDDFGLRLKVFEELDNGYLYLFEVV